MSHHLDNRIGSKVEILARKQIEIKNELEASTSVLRNVGQALERENKTEKVEELEKLTLEIIRASHELQCQIQALQDFPQWYCSSSAEESSIVEKLSAATAKIAGQTSFELESHPHYKLFKEQIWKVHHAGIPMPGQEEEDMLITSTAAGISNMKCPLTLKDVCDLQDPVCSTGCRHVYDRSAILEYLKTQRNRPCPIAGCPKKVTASSLVNDARLEMELRELRLTDASHPFEVVTEVE